MNQIERYKRELQNMAIKPKNMNPEYSKPYVSILNVYGTNEYGFTRDITPNQGYEKSPQQEQYELNNSNIKYEIDPVPQKTISEPVFRQPKQQDMINYDYSNDYTKKQAYINSVDNERAYYPSEYRAIGRSGLSTQSKINNAISEPIYLKKIVYDYYLRNGKDYF